MTDRERAAASAALPGGAAVAAPAPPLARAQRRRGRRLAIASHPFGMTFQVAFTQTLPTLTLLALGASETAVGLQTAFVQGCLLLQLPTLLLVSRVAKRRILLAGHCFAVLAATPLLLLRSIAGAHAGWAVPAVLAAFAFIAAGLATSNTVWFPLLRGYVEPRRIGRFFGTLRTGWHLTLIVFFLGSQAWLARHPDDFAPLFGVAWVLGLARIALIARLPERSERGGPRIRIRETLALAREPSMRRYLAGVAWGRATQVATITFAMVMLRREVGFSAAEVTFTAVATFSGGLVSLYPWGHVVDRAGAAPIFRATCLALAGLVACLVLVRGPGAATLVAVVLFFFAHSVLSAGFGVADTHVLFNLTPSDAPSRALVLGSVAVGAVAGIAPALAGSVLDRALDGAADRLSVYRVFFVVAALLQAGAFLPLRRFAR